jgi:hypothetical protein
MGTITVMGRLYRQVPAQTIELLVMRNRMQGICNPESLGSDRFKTEAFFLFEAFSVREPRSTRCPSAAGVRSKRLGNDAKLD